MSSAITEPKTKKTKVVKKKKDPNAPKRALSAYLFFANENRDIVRAENKTISFGELGKLLGDKWKALSEEEKAPYVQKALNDKKRYEEAKASYEQKLADDKKVAEAKDAQAKAEEAAEAKAADEAKAARQAKEEEDDDDVKEEDDLDAPKTEDEE